MLRSRSSTFSRHPVLTPQKKKNTLVILTDQHDDTPCALAFEMSIPPSRRAGLAQASYYHKPLKAMCDRCFFVTTSKNRKRPILLCLGTPLLSIIVTPVNSHTERYRKTVSTTALSSTYLVTRRSAPATSVGFPAAFVAFCPLRPVVRRVLHPCR
jgi:hypothetical protein